MKQTSRFGARSVVAAGAALLLTLAMGVSPHVQAQSSGPGIRFMGLQGPKAASATPISYIVPVGAKAIYFPNYLSSCVSTAAPAFEVYNDTAITQTVTDLPSGLTIGSLPPKRVGGFTVSGGAGFYLAGLGSNATTALVVKCS